MRQKMAIFKGRISVCRGTNFSRSFHFIFLMKNRGTMQQKMSIFEEGNSACRGCKNFKLNFDEFFDER